MSQQKSILSYFTKVASPSTSIKSPASVSNGNGSAKLQPPTPTTSHDTPRSKSSAKSSEKKVYPSSKKRAQRSESPDSSTAVSQSQKRRKVGKSPKEDSTPVSKPTRRYSRILIQDDSDEDDDNNSTMETSNVEDDGKDEDYKPDGNSTLDDEAETSGLSAETEDGSDNVETEEEEEEEDIKEKNRKRKRIAASIGSAKRSLKTPDAKTTPKMISKGKASIYDTPVPSPKPQGHNGTLKGAKGEGQGWTYLNYEWLKPGRIMDKNRRRPDDPQYNPKTLLVPKDFLDKCTPAIRQWWEMKATNFDTILFFKMGKFYELYHMDAVIAVQELGFVFMKGEHAHCGFPEIAYSQNAEVLVERGYKVARIEQTETPLMMEARLKGRSSNKFDKVVRREICQVTTKGIRLATAQDDRTMPFRQDSEYLYAIVERPETNGSNVIEYGVCFIDTTIGTFNIGQFKDDRHCSRLRTLFSHHTPVQILQEKGKVSATMDTLLRNMGGVRKDVLVPETEFWSCQKILKVLAEGDYFRNRETGSIEWPEYLQNLLSKGDSLGLTPADGWDLGLKCLGAIVSYLKVCLVEHDLLTLRRFSTYAPLDVTFTDKGQIDLKLTTSKFMVLDGSTLKHLEVTEGTKSLLSFLDNCVTSFGKRLLRYWTCVPLANTEDIKKRQDAIEELMSLTDLTKKVSAQMKPLLDLERLLGKIHTFGSVHRSQEHPDSRASFFDEKKYSKRKIIDLVCVLKSFKTSVGIINTIKDSNVELQSELLCSIISEFPDLNDLLQYFDEAFDHQAAIEAGCIKPVHGKVKDYDEAFEAVAIIQSEANDYLREIQKKFRVPKICYFGSDKKRFQLEIPENVSVGKEFDLSSTRKGFKRYTTKETKNFLAKLTEAEIHRENVLKDITRRVFAQFDENREVWNKAVKCLSTLDALISLAKFSTSQNEMCRPEVVMSATPFINIVEGRHPCLEQSKYIPNSVELDSAGEESEGDVQGKGSFLLLTGANMGGKSTIMKQTGLIIILAHMGCYVPAISCRLSVVDRVFTRIGASDNIAGGESTFYVELSETSAILQHSTKASLILMDELGRGTSTFDGNAIAYAVAQALSQRGCRTIFSTHYHALVSSLQSKPSIKVGHMACMVEGGDDDNDDPTQETITFLYKLSAAPCGKSYGFNAAKLAGISDDVVRLGYQKAKELEATKNKLTAFRNLVSKISSSAITVSDIKSLCSC